MSRGKNSIEVALRVAKRLNEAGDINQNGIRHRQRLIEIVVEFVINTVSAGETLFVESVLTVSREPVTVLLACMEVVSRGHEILVGPRVERSSREDIFEVGTYSDEVLMCGLKRVVFVLEALEQGMTTLACLVSSVDKLGSYGR